MFWIKHRKWDLFFWLLDKIIGKVDYSYRLKCFLVCIIQSTELSCSDFTKNNCMSLLLCCREHNWVSFLWVFSRDTEFNIKQTNKSPFSFPPSTIFVTKVMTAQCGFPGFHCAFVPLFFHTHWQFPSCSHWAQLSRMEHGQFFSFHNVTKVTHVSIPFKKPNLPLSRSLFLPRFGTVLLCS